MTYAARQHSPHASHSCLRTAAACNRVRSAAVYGIRGIGRPNKSRAFPIPLLWQRSALFSALCPDTSDKYDSIFQYPSQPLECDIDAVRNRIRNRGCNASTGNSETWKTASISYGCGNFPDTRSAPPARKLGSRHAVSLRCIGRLPLSISRAVPLAASGGVSSAEQKRSDANGVVRDCTHSSLKSGPPPHLQEKRQRVNAASFDAQGTKAHRFMCEARA